MFKVDAHQPVALDHANKFQQLVIQDNGGRFKTSKYSLFRIS